ncbi:lysoplasmalogenase [Flavobacterium luminosum]|uniref:Lysoplasmalogenase n=1 Tax=Flavobacterium luminosum TaxID=2949086 RepID=A0ABT0TPX0_9FLAO|nr:lysoplasmalogenase [Flavobacterium sp. HXWNR70]MCL9808918.1 lysoplasmalogenase [Flavobacterium sp. HXWNR70]
MSKSSKYLNLFVAISLFYLLLIIIKKEEIAWFFKPLLLPGLILATNESLEFPTKKWLLFALVFSWLGDVILMFSPYHELFFVFGLVAFLIAHLLYIVLFTKQSTVKSPKLFWFIIGILLVSGYLYAMLTLLLPSVGGLLIPVSVYAFVISFMLIMAIRGYLTWKAPLNLLILNGAVAFIVSDSLLAIDKFYAPLPNSSLLIMATYLIAQYLICFGIQRLNQR